MADSGVHAIEVEGLTKVYGTLRAVDGVSFTVARGEVFAFLGPNGAGKTTTVEIIETLRTPSSGSVRVLGMDVTARKREIVPRIGVLPQGFNSFDRITVVESIRYYARLFGVRGVDVDALMALAGLRDHRDSQFKNLSGGLKQRLGIVIALVNEPEVLFLDEPTTGLDPLARRAVWDVLRGLRLKGTTIFLTTHYMEEAELLSDRVAIISRGRIVAMGSPEELIQEHTPYMNVTLSGATAHAAQTIRAMGLDAGVDERGNVALRLQSVEEIGNVLEAIRTPGQPLPGLDVRRPSLEEVYLGITASANGSGPAGVGGVS